MLSNLALYVCIYFGTATWLVPSIIIYVKGHTHTSSNIYLVHIYMSKWMEGRKGKKVKAKQEEESRSISSVDSATKNEK